jgi:hypothetical protein
VVTFTRFQEASTRYYFSKTIWYPVDSGRELSSGWKWREQHGIHVLMVAPSYGELNCVRILNPDAITKNSACNLGRGQIYFLKYEVADGYHVGSTSISSSMSILFDKHLRTTARKRRVDIPAGSIHRGKKSGKVSQGGKVGYSARSEKLGITY